MMLMKLIHTIGHSTRSAEEFLALLLSAGIAVLVDVRRYPGSRRYPHFNRAAMRSWLADAGIEYLHMPELGGRRAAQAESANTYWRNAAFRAYADYLSTAEFVQALERLEQLAEARRPVIMCAEAVPWRCHRQLIADALVARGLEVRHIISERSAEAHALNPGAQVDSSGRISYPGAGSTQSSLFDAER
jgi:uncharacterized protein (DUF488 family)